MKARDARHVAFGYEDGEVVVTPSFLRLSLEEAFELAAQSGLRITCSHEEGLCYSQIPDPGSPVAPGAEVRLLFGERGSDDGGRVRVPDLRGLSIREARRLLIACGLRGSLTGFGIVKRQDPAPGSMVARRSNVALVCLPKTRIDTRSSALWRRGGAG